METYGIIGFPLGHSFSRNYFTEKFERENRNACYLNFEIPDISLLTEILTQNPTLKGLNVTIPYKQQILAFLDEISPEAQEIGAVNCVKITRKNRQPFLKGYNTDVYGFRKSLLRFIPSSLNRALILGNGGAAKAVRYVLRSLQMEVRTVSRTPQKEDEIGYDSLPRYIPGFPLLVNTTPLGTWPNTGQCPPVPYELLTEQHYLFDLVYNPSETEFLKRGLNRKAHIQNGLEMLTGQAEAGWKIWQNPEN